MSTQPETLDKLHIPLQPGSGFSPLRMVAVLAATVFLAELIVMVVLYYLPMPNYLVTTLVDGLMMVLLILPALYYLQLKPLVDQMEERIHAEVATRASENLFKKVLDLMPVGVWIIDQKGEILEGNPESHQIWAGARLVGVQGYSEYKGWWPETGEQIKPEEWAAFRAITQKEAILHEEINIEAFNGTRKTILNSAVPILDEHSTLQGAVVVNQDITERRQMEKTLIRTNELLERFFLSINTLLAYMDRDFNFIRVNTAYAESAGHPPEFFPGKNHFELYPHEENQRIFKQVVESGEPYTVLEKAFEYPEYPERGVTYWDWSVHPVLGPNNEVEGVVLSLVNVTERKLAEKRLELQNQELRVLSETEHRQRELAEGLMKSVIALNSSLQLEDLLNTVLDQIRRTVPFRGADIILIEGKSMRVAGFRGFEDLPESAAAMQKIYSIDEFPIYQRILRTLQPVLVPNTLEEPDWHVVEGMEWVRSYLAMPLIREGQIAGVLNLTSEKPGFFTPETSRRLMAFTAQAALALHNAQLYKAEKTARQAAETLSAAARELTKTLDLDQVVGTLVEHLGAVIHADTSGVGLMEGATRLATRLRRSVGVEDAQPIAVDITSSPVLEGLISTRQSTIVQDTATDPDWRPIPGLEAYRSWLAVPLVANDKVIGVVGMGKLETGYFTQEHVQWAEALVGQAAMAIQNAWLFEQVRASSERLQGLSRRLVEVQENERRYIASELHDEVGQALTTLMVELKMIESKSDRPEAVLAEVAAMGHVLDTVIENLHRLAMDLRPVSLDYLGLEAALQQHVEMMNEKLDLEIQFAMTKINERLPANVEIAFYRIVQEALNNVVRHAKASHVDVLITRRDDCLVLMIEDDGIGFIPADAAKGKRLGLNGMRERAEMLDGKLLIESVPDKGTVVLVEVPYANPNSYR